MKRPLLERAVVLAYELGQCWHACLASAVSLTQDAIRSAFSDKRAETPRPAPASTSCIACSAPWSSDHVCESATVATTDCIYCFGAGGRPACCGCGRVQP